MIPAVLSTVLVLTAGCSDADSSTETSVTVEQRRTAINSTMEYLDSGKGKEALAIISTLAKRDPHSAVTQEKYATVLLAHSLQLSNEGDEAKGIALRKLALDAYITACKNSNSPGLLQLSTAQLAQMLGENDVAALYYEQAHNSNVNDGRAAFFLTQLHLLGKEWNQAKHWASESLLRDPNEPYTLLSAALVEAELGNFPQAQSYSERGCKILPDDPNLRCMQARVVRLSGNPTRALEILSALPLQMRGSTLVKDEQLLCMQEIERTTK
jgi:Tfp pilus assembly protein PilF